MILREQYNLQQDGEANYKKGLALILNHFRKHIPLFVGILFLLLIVNISKNIVAQYLLKTAIDINIVEKDIDGLKITALLLILNAVVFVVSNLFRLRATGKLSQKILFEIREKLFSKIQNLPSKFFSENQTGDIIQRLTGNVEGIDRFFSQGLMRVLQVSFSAISTILIMFINNTSLALIPTSGAIITLIFIAIQGKIIEKHISLSLKKEGGLSSNTQESLDGFVAIQADNQQEYWLKKFKLKNQEFFNSAKKVGLISSTSDGFLMAISSLSQILTLAYSLQLYANNAITLGTVVIFVAYVQSLFRNLDGVSRIWNNVKTGISSAERLSAILELENDITTISNPHIPKHIKGEIEFLDVDFSYDKTSKVLSDINFKAEAGKTIAIVGPTGGGKTTFVNLIARLYDVDSGSITLDGVDLKNWDLDSLRKSIGYLIQDNFLFEDTILNNLKYNNPKVTTDSALEMFEFLGAEKFIASLSDGLNTKLETGAENISAGQRQIISLARVLLREPKILILDEATARIDTKSEKMLQEAIEKASKNITTFVIAHRLSTIFNADRIILIKDNTILEQGTHDELIKQKGFYSEMYSRFQTS